MTAQAMRATAVGLLTCPHCGSVAQLERDENIFANQHYPKYPNQTHGFRVECTGSCHSMTCWWHTEAEARSAWNLRPLPAPLSDRETAAWTVLELLDLIDRSAEKPSGEWSRGAITRIASALAAARAEGEAAGWQDISTAPRNGTLILVWSEGSEFDLMKWVGSATTGDFLNAEYQGGIPTHWRPLPAPPADQGGKEP